jgi:3-polyprenyl-4-hydroxybenzoate decarboxylase
MAMEWRSMTAFRDLRDDIERPRRQLGEGTVVKIDGGHWDREIGCLSEWTAERQGPALLFDNIVGHPPGYRVFTNFMGTPAACAVALGLPHDPALTNERHRSPSVAAPTHREGLRHGIMLINACKPYGWKDQYPPANCFDDTYKAETLLRWKTRLPF